MITNHALRAYRDRIENTDAATVCGRIKAIAGSSTGRITHHGGRGKGPACTVVVEDDGNVVTVLAVTAQQQVSAAVRGRWELR